MEGRGATRRDGAWAGSAAGHREGRRSASFAEHANEAGKACGRGKPRRRLPFGSLPIRAPCSLKEPRRARPASSHR